MIFDINNEGRIHMKKQLVVLALTATLSLGLMAGCGSAATGDPASADPSGSTIAIKCADDASATVPPSIAIAEANDRIYDETDGQVQVQVYYDAQLGSAEETLEQVMNGTLQMAHIGTNTFSTYMPTLEALQLPFLLNSYELEYEALCSAEGQALISSVEDLGVKIIFVGEYGMKDFVCADRVINTPADMKGLKIRIAPSNMLQTTMELLGASPISLAYGDIYNGLNTKLIDAIEMNAVSVCEMKFYEVAQNMSRIGLYPYPTCLVINADFFDSLSQEQQDIIIKNYELAQKYNFETTVKEAEAAALLECENDGMKINTIDDIDVFKDAVKPVYEEYAAKDERIAAFIDMVNGK